MRADNGSPDADKKKKSQEEVQKLVENLEKAGVNQDIARKVLSTFDEQKLKKPSDARNLIFQRSLTPTALILL